jgi:hypothetical protein
MNECDIGCTPSRFSPTRLCTGAKPVPTQGQGEQAEIKAFSRSGNHCDCGTSARAGQDATGASSKQSAINGRQLKTSRRPPVVRLHLLSDGDGATNSLPLTAYGLLLDLDVAAECFEDEGGAALTEPAGGALPDDLSDDGETERVVHVDCAGRGLGFHVGVDRAF